MHPDTITNDHIDEVIELRQRLLSTHSVGRRKTFPELLKGLSEEGRWLLTFFLWFSLINFRFHGVEEAQYFSIPAQMENKAAFRDFIEVVRYFNRRRVTPTRERVLIKFLASCNAKYRDFYLLSFSKKFAKGFPLHEVQTMLNLDSIDIQEVYGAVKLLQTTFSDLKYPVAISTMSAPDHPLSVVGREPNGIYALRQEDGSMVPANNPIPNDLQFIHTPRFTLVGFAGKKGEFTAIDMFPMMQFYRRYTRGDSEVPWPERVRNLRDFLHGNLLHEVHAGYLGFATNETELIPEIVQVMQESENPYVVLADQDTAKTGDAFAVEVRPVEGQIEDYWIEDGIPKGFLIWFNGSLFPVAFSFTGKANAMLRAIDPLRGKLLSFLYIKIGEARVGVGREVLWHKKPWRTARLRGSKAYIEKCIFCGTTEQRHTNHGICHSCECNLYHHYRVYGPSKWITPSRKTTDKRAAGGWEPSFLNSMRYCFKGHVLEAREDGCWRFRPDEKARLDYFRRWME